MNNDDINYFTRQKLLINIQELETIMTGMHQTIVLLSKYYVALGGKFEITE
jgi:hypothetical protein